MTYWPPHLYRNAGRERKVKEEVVEAALEDAFLVSRKIRFPPILTLKHLAVQADVSYQTLRSIVERNHRSSYRMFQIKKRMGGKRLICVPSSQLLQTQKWINRRVLRIVPPHSCSMAYVRGRSVVDCASQHCGCQWLIKLDVRRFFESISERQVFHVFQQFGYRPLVAFELARLCTRVAMAKDMNDGRGRWTNSAMCLSQYEHKSYHSNRIGHLPQGAPTSPALSNICCRSLDDSLQELAHEHQVVFTRYADDIVFSTTEPSSRSECSVIAGKVMGQLAAIGLRINSTKTAIVPPGARKVVLGLLVDGETPRLQRKYRKALECHLYHAKKWGPARHAEKRGFSSVFGLRVFLEGKLAFASQVEPDYGIALKERFLEIDWPFV